MHRRGQPSGAGYIPTNCRGSVRHATQPQEALQMEVSEPRGGLTWWREAHSLQVRRRPRRRWPRGWRRRPAWTRHVCRRMTLLPRSYLQYTPADESQAVTCVWHVPRRRDASFLHLLDYVCLVGCAESCSSSEQSHQTGRARCPTPFGLEGSLEGPVAAEAVPGPRPAACASVPPTPREAQAARRRDMFSQCLLVLATLGAMHDLLCAPAAPICWVVQPAAGLNED